jgi:hypothetical protein
MDAARRSCGMAPDITYELQKLIDEAEAEAKIAAEAKKAESHARRRPRHARRAPLEGFRLAVAHQGSILARLRQDLLELPHNLSVALVGDHLALVGDHLALVRYGLPLVADEPDVLELAQHDFEHDVVAALVLSDRLLDARLRPLQRLDAVLQVLEGSLQRRDVLCSGGHCYSRPPYGSILSSSAQMSRLAVGDLNSLDP